MQEILHNNGRASRGEERGLTDKENWVTSFQSAVKRGDRDQQKAAQIDRDEWSMGGSLTVRGGVKSGGNAVGEGTEWGGGGGANRLLTCLMDQNLVEYGES